ncbi:hypothetical protein D3C75_397180 [compost metagenome]
MLCVGRRSALSLLVNKPAVKSVMARNLDQLVSSGKGAVTILLKHLLDPFILSAIYGWWEEHRSDNRHAIFMSRVDRISAWRYDDPFARGTTPIDQLVNILPIGKCVSFEFA